MDTLTRMYADAWSRLTVEMVELVVVVPPPSDSVDAPDLPDEGGLHRKGTG